MDYTLISSADLMTDYIQRYHPSGEALDESLFRSIADDTLSKVMTNQTRLFGIVLLEVKNFTAKLPKNYVSDIQAIFRLKKKMYPRVEVSQFIKRIPGNKCHLEINVKCPACHQEQCECGNVLYEADVDAIWRMSNPEYTAASSKFFSDYANTNSYRRDYIDDAGFKLMKRTQNNWFAIRYYVGDCVDILDTTPLEYKMVKIMAVNIYMNVFTSGVIKAKDIRLKN